MHGGLMIMGVVQMGNVVREYCALGDNVHWGLKCSGEMVYGRILLPQLGYVFASD